MPEEPEEKKPPMKDEERNTLLIIGGMLAVYVIPAIILAIFRAGAIEYVVALTIFIAVGVIFWDAGAVLRD